MLAVLWERTEAEARFWRAKHLEAFAREAEAACDVLIRLYA